MNIDAAVEIRRHWRKHPPALVVAASQMIVDEHLRLTDSTPLTRALIEAELGNCTDYENVWSVNQSYVRWCPVLKRATTHGVSVSTLGHLRQLVAMLRGGGA